MTAAVFTAERRGAPLVAGGLAVAALLAAVAATRQPELVIIATAGAATVAFLATRLVLATAILAASFYFEAYLTEGFGFVTPAKLIGAMAVLSFVVEWALGRRRLVFAPHLVPILVLAASMIMSVATARDTGSATAVATRYVMFFVLFFLVLQAAQRREQVDQMLDVAVYASGVAALLGLQAYFAGTVDRASGPIDVPGDFGFLLATTFPIAIYRFGRATGVRRVLVALVLAVMSAAILATFARAPLVGMAAAGAWALATGRLRLRWGVLALALLVLSGAIAYQLEPDLIETTLNQKQNIAQSNVDTRMQLWRVAVDQFNSSPAFGVGPGHYEVRFTEFQFPTEHEVTNAHNAYLLALAELGAVGTAAFLAYLAVAWWFLRRRIPDDPDESQLVGALAAGFLIAVVGALFTAKQFTPPFWLFPALGAGLLEVRRRAGRT